MASKPITVMQVVSNLDVGGAQEVVRTLAENFEGADCHAIVCTFKDGPLRGEIERLGIPVAVLPERQHSVVKLPHFLQEMWRLRQRLVALIDKYEVDVLQTHLLRSLDFLLLSLRFSRDVLVYWTFQNAHFDLRPDHLQRHGWLLRPKRLAHHMLYRLGSRWVNGLIAVSEDTRTAILQTMPGIPANKVSVIFNSVDVSRYRVAIDSAAVRKSLGLAVHDPVMAVVATFKRQKGHSYLVEAAATVVRHVPNLRILLIGDGELRPAIEAQTWAYELQNNILFLGTRSDVPQLLGASDCFVLPSLWEGLSMALVEAMASELPVIATAVSGTNQVMVDGETGLLVPPGDATALADAMLRLLADTDRATQMGKNGRRRVEQTFSARKQVQDHLDLFAEELTKQELEIVIRC